MNMIDQIAYFNKFARIHPGEKALICFFLLFTSMVFRAPSAALFVFIATSFYIILARVPLFQYARLLFAPAAFILAGVLPIAFSFDGWLSIQSSEETVQKAVETASAAFAGAAALYAFILTTPFNQVAWLMKKCRIPAVFVEITALVYRFIFQLAEKRTDVTNAQLLRSGTPGIQTAARAAVHIFTSTLFEMDKRQQAAELRGSLDYIPTGEWSSFWRRKDDFIKRR